MGKHTYLLRVKVGPDTVCDFYYSCQNCPYPQCFHDLTKSKQLKFTKSYRQANGTATLRRTTSQF